MNREEVRAGILILPVGCSPYTATVYILKAPGRLYSALFPLFFGLPRMTFLSHIMVVLPMSRFA